MAGLKRAVRIDVPGRIEKIIPVWGGLIAVQIGGKWYITGFKTGELVESDYDDLIAFTEGEDRGWLKKDGKYRLIKADGRFLEREADNAAAFSEGLSRIGFNKPEGRRYGFCDKDGRLVIDAQYTLARDFRNGYAYAEIRDEKQSIIKLGFINKDKVFCEIKTLPFIKMKSGSFSDVNDSFSDVYDGTYIQYQGVVNHKYRYAVKELKSNKVLQFGCSAELDLMKWDGGALIPKKDGKGYYQYKPVCDELEKQLKEAFQGEFIAADQVRTMGSLGYIRRIGDHAYRVWKGYYKREDLQDAWPFYKGVARVQDLGGSFHFADEAGNYLEKLDEQACIEDTYDFKADFVPVKIGLEWALMNRSYKIASEARYDSVAAMFGFACVATTKKGERMLIDLRENHAGSDSQSVMPELPKPPKEKQKMRSLQSFAGELLKACSYDDKQDMDKEALDKRYKKDEWLRCESVRLAEDILYAYMYKTGKKEKILRKTVWETEKQYAVHYTLMKTPADGTQVLVKMVAGEDGVFLCMYHLPEFELVNMEKDAVDSDMCNAALPFLKDAVEGAEVQAISKDMAGKWMRGGQYSAGMYRFDDGSAFQKALDGYAFGLEEEKMEYYNETSGSVLLRDEKRPWCNAMRFKGAARECAAALVFDIKKKILEVYLCDRYAEWYSKRE